MSVAHLDSQDAEDDEEGAADEDDVADGPQGGDERLHDQLQPRRSAYHPAGALQMHEGGCFFAPLPLRNAGDARRRLPYLSGRSVRSSRRTLRMPRIRFPPL